MHPRAQQLIEQLNLQAHPEGGYYREVYRSELAVFSTLVDAPRAAISDIYFLLPAGQISRWHRVRHAELWNFYEGSPLTLHQLSADLSQYRCVQLDPQVACYKHLVPAGAWQAAQSLGDYSLVGCSVSPGFDFADFCLLKELPETLARINAEHPALAHLL